MEELKFNKDGQWDLVKAWLKRGDESKAAMSDKDPHALNASSKKGAGHSKDIETKRKEVIDHITDHDMAQKNGPKGVTRKETHEMHTFNHSAGEVDDAEIHYQHKRKFPEQY